MRARRDVDPSELKADPLAFTPVGRKPRRRWGLRLFVIFLLLIAGGTAGAWYQYGNRLKVMLGLGRGSEIPLVKADPGPIKVRPESPGGLEVPDRDKLVYQRIQGEAGEEKVERLLPPPETPLPPPVKPSSAEAPAKPALEPAAPSAAPPPLPPPAELAVRPRPSVPPQVTERLPKVPTAAQVAKTKPPEPAPIAPPGPTQTSPPAAEAKPAASAPAKEASPEPSPTPVAGKAPTSEPAIEPTANAAISKGYLIQLAAVRQPEHARKEWERLQRTHPDLLGDLQLSVVKADLGPQKGIYYRLRAGPLPDEATARKRCAGLSQQKVGCLVVRAPE